MPFCRLTFFLSLSLTMSENRDIGNLQTIDRLALFLITQGKKVGEPPLLF